MITSCFFCRNLLSDYIEGMLPGERHKEVKEHLGTCAECLDMHRDLCATLDLLHGLPQRPLSHEIAIQITEAVHSPSSGLFSKPRVSQAVLFLTVPALLFAAAVVAFPKVFPWITQLVQPEEKVNFVRYFPLLQGAALVVEEQATWLYAREPFMRSFWEEGGLSPEEFERTFSVRPSESESEILEEESP